MLKELDRIESTAIRSEVQKSIEIALDESEGMPFMAYRRLSWEAKVRSVACLMEDEIDEAKSWGEASFVLSEMAGLVASAQGVVVGSRASKTRGQA